MRLTLRPYQRGLFVLLIPFCVLLTGLAQANPHTVERLYSRGAYPVISGALGRLFGFLPFSVSEFLVFIVAAGALVWLIYGVSQIIRKKEKNRRLLAMLADAGCVLGVGYFLFIMLCGLNYHRVTFAEQSGLDIRPSSVAELAAVYAELVEQANELRPLVAENENGVMVFGPNTAYDMAKIAPEGMARAAGAYPVLGGFTPKPKPVLASRLMSAIDIAGIYIPFTFEANVNAHVPHFNIPFSMMHELAHFKGFMREDEANFIAFIACRETGDVSYRYSGTVIALIYCGNALFSANPDLYRQISAELSEAVLRDFADNRAYWRQFESPVSDFAVMVNNAYLKTNLQADGVQSYGRMVDLMLADYRARHFLA